MTKLTPKDIDVLLPQTQCGLCGYGGCMPYAEAMIDAHASINLCPPGGVSTLIKLGERLNQDPTPFIAEMQQKAKPPMLAIIREDKCIGCTKCIQACPVDAILGATKQMHTIIAAECTGCELCVPACPVDCIDMNIIARNDDPTRQDQYRARYLAREKRLEIAKKERYLAKLDGTESVKKSYVQHALARVKAKKELAK